MLHGMIRLAHTGGVYSPTLWPVMVPQPGAVPPDAAATISTAMVGLVQTVPQAVVVARTQQAHTRGCGGAGGGGGGVGDVVVVWCMLRCVRRTYHAHCDVVGLVVRVRANRWRGWWTGSPQGCWC